MPLYFPSDWFNLITVWMFIYLQMIKKHLLNHLYQYFNEGRSLPLVLKARLFNKSARGVAASQCRFQCVHSCWEAFKIIIDKFAFKIAFRCQHRQPIPGSVFVSVLGFITHY